MNNINGFSAIAAHDARLLILGSMPSETSLQKQEYYGHQRNAFWSIMQSVLSKSANNQSYDYSQRKKLLINNKIALWDVLQSCHRSGSLDAAIKMDSISMNDFDGFFSAHLDIKYVFFNGNKAEAIYKKYIFNTIKIQFAYLNYIKLPSTSPAYAAMTLEQKTEIWKKELKATHCL